MKALSNNRCQSKIPKYLWGCLVLFFVSQVWSQNIQQLEYYFGPDPGFGKATPITANANTGSLIQTLTLPISSLDEGFHRLTLRSKDDNGTWGLYEASIFYISDEVSGNGSISNIAGAEYWFENDPGFGKGTPLTISGNPSEITTSFAIPLGNLEVGFHTLGLRTKNLDGVWSLYEKKIFYIFRAEENLPPAALTAVEFLYDLELGFGTGTAANLTPTGNPDEYLVEIPTTMVSCDGHDIWISVKNANGNYSLYQVALDVDVFDNLPPTIVVFPNIEVALDATGKGSITLADVNNGTFDDCELVSVALNQATFDYTCANLGANMVTITATDAEKKVSTQKVTITVVDLINPLAKVKDITVQLDADGKVGITPSQIENGSTDNCGIASSSLDVSTFNCTNLGTNTITFTVKDAYGNTNSTTAKVTVEDKAGPKVLTKNITIQLDAAGQASITANDIDKNSTDNCAIANYSVDIKSFTCANIGANTVTLSVTDQSNNTADATAIVTIEDLILPTALGKDITRDLAGASSVTITAADIDNGSSDNCELSLSIDNDTFTAIGVYPVSLTATDRSGNSSNVPVSVTIFDSTLGIEDFDLLLNEVKIFPNPVENTLYISTELQINRVEIYDMLGKRINLIEDHTNAINTAEMRIGTYFLKIHFENQAVFKRFIKK